jgi:hypothetical protein
MKIITISGENFLWAYYAAICTTYRAQRAVVRSAQREVAEPSVAEIARSAVERFMHYYF